MSSILKKVLSILLLLLLFFNWVGYRILSEYLQIESDYKLEAKLDRNEYTDSELLELRVPLNLPYYSSQGYERYNGEIEINGVHYNYVKRKVENGVLVLMCIPNEEKKKIQLARDGFFKIINDLSQGADGKKSDGGNLSLLKNFLGDYRQEKNDWSITRIAQDKLLYSIFITVLPPPKHGFIPEQPPEA